MRSGNRPRPRRVALRRRQVVVERVVEAVAGHADLAQHVRHVGRARELEVRAGGGRRALERVDVRRQRVEVHLAIRWEGQQVQWMDGVEVCEVCRHL